MVGTVTFQGWEGNPRPRMQRFLETESIVNWMGLPGLGAEKVCEILKGYGESCLPITWNFMSTPQRKNIEEELEDIERTILLSKEIQTITIQNLLKISF